MVWKRNKAFGTIVALVFAMIVAPEFARAAATEEGLSRSKWDRDRSTYDYGDLKEKQPEAPEELPEWSPPETDWWSVNPTLLNVILIVLAAGVLAFLINAFLIAPGKRNAKTESLAYAVEILEENLPDADVDPLVRQALEQGEYALVIRLRYLRILQLLDGQKSIVWKREKTNRAYLDELAEHPMRPEFAELTRLFEAIRYGDRPLDRAGYERVAPGFVQFINRLMR